MKKKSEEKSWCTSDSVNEYRLEKDIYSTEIKSIPYFKKIRFYLLGDTQDSLYAQKQLTNCKNHH